MMIWRWTARDKEKMKVSISLNANVIHDCDDHCENNWKEFPLVSGLRPIRHPIVKESLLIYTVICSLDIKDNLSNFSEGEMVVKIREADF
jgi:hypothetical protein